MKRRAPSDEEPVSLALSAPRSTAPMKKNKTECCSCSRRCKLDTDRLHMCNTCPVVLCSPGCAAAGWTRHLIFCFPKTDNIGTTGGPGTTSHSCATGDQGNHHGDQANQDETGNQPGLAEPAQPAIEPCLTLEDVLPGW